MCDMTRDDYENNLRHSGFEKIGEGCFASVWGLTPTAALKVSSDKAWLAFMLWAQKNALGRKYVPKLYGVKWHVPLDDDGEPDHAGAYFTATMERIECTAEERRDDYSEEIPYHPWEYDSAVAELRTAISKAGFNTNDCHDNNWGFFRNGNVCVFDPTGFQDQDTPSQFASVDTLRQRSTDTLRTETLQLSFSFMTP